MIKSTTNNNQAGVVLIPILLLLTLFGILGVSFVFYATPAVCEKNPTVETRDGRCVHNVGPDRR